MAMDSILKTLNATRGYFLKTVGELSEDQLLEVPEGWNNNVLWHLGHIVYANYGLTYRPCGVDMPVPPKYTEFFKGGSKPADWTETPSIEEIMGHFKSQAEKITADVQAGKFGDYNKVELFPGYALESLEDGLAFNIFHEGVHIGMVAKLVNQLSAVSA